MTLWLTKSQNENIVVKDTKTGEIVMTIESYKPKENKVSLGFSASERFNIYRQKKKARK
jgi:hypothetical protein